jgi:hypothetical protein
MRPQQTPKTEIITPISRLLFVFTPHSAESTILLCNAWHWFEEKLEALRLSVHNAFLASGFFKLNPKHWHSTPTPAAKNANLAVATAIHGGTRSANQQFRVQRGAEASRKVKARSCAKMRVPCRCKDIDRVSPNDSSEKTWHLPARRQRAAWLHGTK